VQTGPASRCLFIEELRTVIWVHQHDDAFGSSISKPVGMLLAFSSTPGVERSSSAVAGPTAH
jgi:hypothetical protein